MCSVHREVLRLHYDDYARCASEHHLIRVRALLDAQGENEPIMTVANITLSRPELLIQVGSAQDSVYVSYTICFININGNSSFSRYLGRLSCGIK